MKLIACGRVNTFFFFFPLEKVNTSSFFLFKYLFSCFAYVIRTTWSSNVVVVAN